MGIRYPIFLSVISDRSNQSSLHATPKVVRVAWPRTHWLHYQIIQWVWAFDRGAWLLERAIQCASRGGAGKKEKEENEIGREVVRSGVLFYDGQSFGP